MGQGIVWYSFNLSTGELNHFFMQIIVLLFRILQFMIVFIIGIIMLLKRPSSVCDARCDATVLILNISEKMEWFGDFVW